MFKKLMIGLFFLLVSIVIVGAQNAQRVNTTLSTSYIAIEVPRVAVGSCVNYAWVVSDNSAYYIADDISGTNESLIPANTPMSWECMENPTGTLFFVKAAAGTPVFTVFYQSRR